jgi:tetratricopeptide (TPR) repeat protein
MIKQTTKWLRISACSLLALGVAHVANAQQATSAEFSEKYNAGATEYKAHSFQDAMRDAKAAHQVAKTGFEKQASLKLMLAIESNLHNYDEMAETLNALIAAEGTTPAEKVGYHKTLGQVYGQLRKVDKAIAETREYLKEGGGTPADWDALAGLYATQKDCPNALDALSKATGGSKTLTESQLKIQQGCYFRKDNGKYLAVSEEIMHRFPSKDAYARVLAAYQESKTLDDLAQLAILRYGFERDWLTDEADYRKLADLALDVGATLEAQHVLERGMSRKVLKAGDKSDALMKQAKDRAAEDAKSIAQADAEAKAGKNGENDVRVGIRFYSMGQYDKAIEALNRGLSADHVARVKRVDDAKMVLGICLNHQKKVAEATKAFNDAKSDPRMEKAARMWLGN